MIFFDYKVLLLLASSGLSGCASQYTPLTTSSNHAGSYQEWLLNEKQLNVGNNAETNSNNQATTQDKSNVLKRCALWATKLNGMNKALY